MKMAEANVTVAVSLSIEITHASPQGKGGKTPCCNHTVFELKRTDRLTNDMALVTCPGTWLRDGSKS
jgi:hypothetical protein